MRVTALNLALGTHHDASTTGLVSLTHTGKTVYVSSRREVRCLDVLHESVQINVRIVNISAASVNHLAEVMRGDVGCHTDSNTVTAVNEEVRNLCRHYGRLHERVVEVGCHVHGVLLKVVHDMLSHLRESALRVTHSGRRVTVHRTKVTLSVHKHVAHVPVLSHAY